MAALDTRNERSSWAPVAGTAPRGGGHGPGGAAPGDGVVEVSVSDTRVGIAPEDEEAVFEDFRQTGTAAQKVS